MEYFIVGATLFIGTIAVVLSIKPIITDTEHMQSLLEHKYRFTNTSVAGGVKLQFFLLSKLMTWQDILDAWRTDESFCQYFNEALAGCSYADFFWECVPLRNADTPFECVLLDAKGVLVNRAASHTAYDEHFSSCKGTVTFPNLNSDATLVVPCPKKDGDSSAFVTLASFLRNSPEANAFWKDVSQAIAKSDKDVWVNTDGREVPWLHIRLDSGPKYTKYYTSA